MKVVYFYFYFFTNNLEFSNKDDPHPLEGTYIHGFTNFDLKIDKNDATELNDAFSVDMIWFNGQVIFFDF